MHSIIEAPLTMASLSISSPGGATQCLGATVYNDSIDVATESVFKICGGR